MGGGALLPSDLAPGLLLGDGVEIGDGVQIGGGVVIHAGARIGAGARVGDHAQIRDGAVIGAAATVGSFCSIDPGVLVGERASVQTRCYLSSGSVLEDDVFQRHVIIGETTRAGGSIEGLTSRVTRRGALINTTTDPQALTGKVVDIVAHVAATLATYGEMLSPGDIIITGSITPPQMLEADDTAFIHALDPVGEVRVAFTND